MANTVDIKDKIDDVLPFGLSFLRILSFLIVCASLAVVVISFKEDSLDEFGKLGDSINGVTAPIISLMVVIVTFLAFWVQFEANQELRKDIKIDRFETRFYELLKLHQGNVTDIDIASKFSGRKAFVRMYWEVRFIYAFIEEQFNKWDENEEPTITEDKRAFMELAYTIFFYGLSEVSTRDFIYKHESHMPFFIEVIKKLEIEKQRSKAVNSGITTYSLSANSSSLGLVLWKPTYTPFEGHVSKLGHYYRHLYQLIKFISTNTSIGLSFKERYAYIKIVRAQLSNHEQTLIFFNSFFIAGSIWWEEKDKEFKNDRGEVISYFLDYRIIKNIPFNLTDFGPSPVDEFERRLVQRGRNEKEIEAELKNLFEWIGG